MRAPAAARQMPPTCAFLAAGAGAPRLRKQTWARAPPRRARVTRAARMMSSTQSRVGQVAADADARAPGASFMPGDGRSFEAHARELQAKGELPIAAVHTLLAWRASYATAASRWAAVGAKDAEAFTERAFFTLAELMRRHVATPIEFEPFHRRLAAPYDYYAFGVDFAAALVDVARSRVVGVEHVRRAQSLLAAGHNVVFLSNHQSEADPYAIDALFTSVAQCPRKFARELVFMAGDRVREDLVVVPFSAGRNLLTVYSKKHLDDVPALRAEKVTHNRRTISVAQRMFAGGGVGVWFAPSGGRDRRSGETGRVEVAQFDAGAIEMMRFTAAKSGKPTHFFPMSLVTYDMLPPPSSVGGAAMGEERVVNHIPLFMSVGEEIEWRDAVPESITDKREKRDMICRYVQKIVEEGYAQIGGHDF